MSEPMQPMSAAEIRERFQRFFEERGHTRVPSAPLLAVDDPTLLFVNSGMAPFKRVLTGEERRAYVRAVDAQVCLRVAGRHNDFEEVGRTPRHQTLFEMLGNWSFGDYFKRDAIRWAWELLTGEFGLDPQRIAATVYTDDHEAHRIWSEEIGLPPERLVRWGDIAAGNEQNFWRMGDTGPCGPCSELHFDRGAHLSEGPHCIPDHSETCPRWLEIWNLVFMEFDRAADGSLTPLPFRSVDTGMGLERVASVVQGVDSNYGTDLFVPIIERLAEFIGHDPETVEAERFSYQVVADHSRAMTFLLSEGVRPSNEGAGYVLRRIIRRAVRHGRLLGIRRPFLRQTADVVIDLMGDAYPALRAGRDAILEGIEAEEEKFARTLQAGSARLDELVAEALDRSRLAAEVRGITLVHGGTPDVKVTGDPRQLLTALGNLVDNAVRYGPEGSRVAVATALVRDGGTSVAEISVTDEGPGIAPERREDVFRRFHSDRPEGESFGNHSGLGLAIGRAIAEAHDGSLTAHARSDDAPGACLRLALPVAP